jgi:pyruvate/2-oxoglutarate dehydrogenase complex dihydrolipoamide dehydrogenase (E3) component
VSDYHLIAIGAGTGGLTVTELVARTGKKVALIERFKPGGDCLYTGCVPTKSLVHAAKLLHHTKDGARFGLVADDVRLDYAAVRRHVLQAQAEAGEIESPEVIASHGVELITGEASFVDAHTVDVNGTRLSADYIVIATGGEPAIPPIPGLAEAGFDTNVQAVAWETLPASLGVIGGGPIGTEFAQLMGRFGVKVTQLQGAPRILERDDPDASALMKTLLEREGLAVHTGVKVTRVEGGASGKRVWFESNGAEQSFECERLLVAAGRKPELGSLNLAAAGVEANNRGIVVNEKLQSNVKHIFAVGDIAGGYQFTHVAEAQGRLVANIIVGKRFQKWSDRVVPRVTYTDPEVASVGLTEEQARKERKGVKVWNLPLTKVDRAITMGATDGFFKVITAKGWQQRIPKLSGLVGDEIVGACLVGPNAGELLMPIVVAMRARLPIGLVALNMQAYPTMSLGLRMVTGQPFGA